MASKASEGSGLLALATFATISLGLGTALFYQHSQMTKKEQEAKQALKNEKKKHHLRMKKTAEYQRRKKAYEEKKAQLESRLRTVACFDENDEMVLKKIDVTQHETLPDGFKFVHLDEKPLAVHKVTADLTGENFIENLEQVNKQRVEIPVAKVEEQPA